MGKGGDHSTHVVKEKALKVDAPAAKSSSSSSDPFLERLSKLVLPEPSKWVAPCSKWDEEKWKTMKFPTVGELRAVIPKHCFQRSALKGFAYILRDLFFLACVVFVAAKCGLSATEAPSTPLAFAGWCVAWFVYFFVAGIAASGLWVIGHECGHGAFSEYPLLNDTVGLILHTLFLVPYFSWQYSHAKHHKRTNHLTEGESHVPDTFADKICQWHYQMFETIGEKGFAYYVVFIFHSFLLYPLYFLGFNSGARVHGCGHDPPQPYTPTSLPDHFRPNSPLFHDANSITRAKVVLNNVALVAWMWVLYLLVGKFGFWNVLLWYEGPNWMVNQVFLVWVTWIQHTHPSIPHFGPDEWNWVKATLCGTVDHYYVGIIEHCSHHIGSTHVCHHLFHEIPFYHAPEATAALKKFLEPMELYNYNPGCVETTIAFISRRCHYVDGIAGIQYYKSFTTAQTEARMMKKKSL